MRLVHRLKPAEVAREVDERLLVPVVVFRRVGLCPEPVRLEGRGGFIREPYARIFEDDGRGAAGFDRADESGDDEARVALVATSAPARTTSAQTGRHVARAVITSFGEAMREMCFVVHRR